MAKLTRFEFNETSRSAQYDSAGKLTVTVIKPGISKNKRYYSEAVLKKDHGVFKNAKMFADHQTESEQRSRPEGSLKDWVASLKEVWVESDGSIKGVAVVIDPAFKKKLELLAANNLLNTMGISIRAAGEASDGEHAGQRCKIIESLLECRSVDFVTFPAAGGRVDAIESVQQPSIQSRLKAGFSALGLSSAEATLAARGPRPSSTEFDTLLPLLNRLDLMDRE